MALTPPQIKAIERSLDEVFDRLKQRVLGPGWVGDKKIEVRFDPNLSLPGIFTAASREENNIPDPDLLNSLLDVASKHLEAQRATAKAQVVRAVDGFLRGNRGASLEDVLGGELADISRKTIEGVRRVVDTEASNVRNVGVLDGITKVNEAMGIEDPLVYFVVVRDRLLCKECRRLHLLEDGVTPRVWRMSELGHGYHKRGDEAPKIGGLHPHCRCSVVTLLPGYGFDDSGAAVYIGKNHNEHNAQRR